MGPGTDLYGKPCQDVLRYAQPAVWHSNRVHGNESCRLHCATLVRRLQQLVYAGCPASFQPRQRRICAAACQLVLRIRHIEQLR